MDRRTANIETFITEKITNVKKPNEREWFYKFKRSENGKSVVEIGFEPSDECGLYISEKLERHVKNNGESCYTSACLSHLQWIKWESNISSMNDWKEKTFFNGGRKLGGKTCHLLQIYGLASLVPIVLNIIFSMFVFLEDLKQNKSSKKDVIFVLFACYPQVKCLKFLFQFLIHKNEAKLNEDKIEYDIRIGSLEAFLESALQVRYFI